MSESLSVAVNESSTADTSNVPEASLYTDFASDVVQTPGPVQVENVVVPIVEKETPKDAEKSVEEPPKRPKRQDWIDTENPLHCKPCEYVAQNIQEFQDHSLSYKHIKKTAEVLEMRVNPKKDEDKKKPISFHCDVCLCSCNSETAWNSHLVGQKHRKNLEKQGAARMFQKQKVKYGAGFGSGGNPGPMYNTQFTHGYNKPYQKPVYQQQKPVPQNDFAQYKEPLIGLEYVTEIQVTGQNPRYHCKLCDAKFDHNVKFPHLVGAKHRFNVLKEKSPTIAQEIRIGVKKRSQLTGKLLDEAMKIEQQEGRRQVMTRVEASPFDPATNNPQPSGYSQFTVPGRGRGHPFGKSNPNFLTGHPIKGQNSHPLKGNVMRKNTYQNQSYPGYGNTNVQQYGNHPANYGPWQGNGPNTYQSGTNRGYSAGNFGRGRGRGRGRGNSSGYGRGSMPTDSSYLQANPSGFNNNNKFSSSPPSSLLPKQAFRPRSPPRQHSFTDVNSNNPVPQSSPSSQHPASLMSPTTTNQLPGQGGPHPISWSEPLRPPMGSPQPTIQAQTSQSGSTSTESSAQSLLQGLSDLGKLVSSEEEASIALQVSNALTQALLKYRMQSLEEGQK